MSCLYQKLKVKCLKQDKQDMSVKLYLTRDQHFPTSERSSVRFPKNMRAKIQTGQQNGLKKQFQSLDVISWIREYDKICLEIDQPGNGV